MIDGRDIKDSRRGRCRPNLHRLEEGERIALAELKNMWPYALIFNGLVLTAGGLLGRYGVITVDFRLFTGLLVGNICAAVNFYLIGFTAGRAVRARNAKSFFRRSYAMRYLSIFAILAIMLSFGLINGVTAVIPLLYPSTYYKILAITSKTV